MQIMQAEKAHGCSHGWDEAGMPAITTTTTTTTTAAAATTHNNNNTLSKIRKAFQERWVWKQAAPYSR